MTSETHFWNETNINFTPNSQNYSVFFREFPDHYSFTRASESCQVAVKQHVFVAIGESRCTYKNLVYGSIHFWISKSSIYRYSHDALEEEDTISEINADTGNQAVREPDRCHWKHWSWSLSPWSLDDARDLDCIFVLVGWASGSSQLE